MKSKKGGARYDKDGKCITGRKPTGKGERISYQPTKENLEWLRSQKASNSKIINAALDMERKGSGE